MTDVHSKETRSHNMSMIKGKNTKPEIMVRKFLFANGYRFKLHDKNLPGKPDMVLPKFKTVIFVHGCFWHAHEGCSDFVVPKTNTDWWVNKLVNNKKKDTENSTKLSDLGWKVIVIFECRLKKEFRINSLNELITNIY